MGGPSTSTPQERSGASALNPILVKGTLDICVASKDRASVMQEVVHLKVVSIVVQVLGSRSSRGDLQHLSHASLQADFN